MTASNQFKLHNHILNSDNAAVQQEHAVVVWQQHRSNFCITSQSTTIVHKFPEFSFKRLSTRGLPGQKIWGPEHMPSVTQRQNWACSTLVILKITNKEDLPETMLTTVSKIFESSSWICSSYTKFRVLLG